jgi:DNA (cytosine-5)-methyltransferase 1
VAKPRMVKKEDAGTFIDLFAGCGGLSLGLMQAGWKGLFAIEKDALAFKTLKTNLLENKGHYSYAWPQWLPREPWPIDQFLERHKKYIKSLTGHVDLIAGGPPCQGFSLAGKRKRNDTRNHVINEYLEVVRLVRPPLLLIENVPGINVAFGKTAKAKFSKSKKGRPLTNYARRITGQLELMGYMHQSTLLKAVEFGVPQLRPRFILLGIRRDLLGQHIPSLESIIKGLRIPFLISKGLPPDHAITTREAISDLETRGLPLIDCPDSVGFKQVKYGGPRTRYQELLHSGSNGKPPNSMRLVNHEARIRQRFKEILATCRRGVLLNNEDRSHFKLKKHCVTPLDPNKPSATLTTLPDDLIHYSEPRILTARECARLQSFPDWYSFQGKYTTGGDRRKRECPRYTQIGNAVPPFLAEVLGDTLFDVKRSLSYSGIFPMKKKGSMLMTKEQNARKP